MWGKKEKRDLYFWLIGGNVSCVAMLGGLRRWNSCCAWLLWRSISDMNSCSLHNFWKLKKKMTLFFNFLRSYNEALRLSKSCSAPQRDAKKWYRCWKSDITVKRYDMVTLTLTLVSLITLTLMNTQKWLQGLAICQKKSCPFHRSNSWSA